MRQAQFNCVISGFKSLESEIQDFDPEKIALRFKDLMKILHRGCCPAIPSLKIHKETFISRNPTKMYGYQKFIGHFKKPNIGMFLVIKDIVQEMYGQSINTQTKLMLGDTVHDEQAAQNFGLSFLKAHFIHQGV